MPPSFLLSILLGATYGTLFHIWRGHTLRDLVIYFLTGIIGFGLGQALGTILQLGFFMMGSLHLVEATVISIVSLFLMQWLKPFPAR